MHLRFVVQRYGVEVAGGAEQHCRLFAERLAIRGHDVEVITSTALDYATWRNHYPAGTETVNGVRVRRLEVRHARRPDRFTPLDTLVLGPHTTPLALQLSWVQELGPDLLGLSDALAEPADATVFFTYLYAHTVLGLPVATSQGPVVLHPTAHAEPHLRSSVHDTSLRQPDLLALSTEEERALLTRRLGREPDGDVIGIGFESSNTGDGNRFRARFELGDRPYLLMLGRIDPHKGSLEAHEYFTTYKQRHPDSPLALVVVGQQVIDLPPHPDVLLTGFVDDQTRDDALAGATVLLQPSYFESFSMVLCEAWAHEVPTLVQGRCDVLRGQVTRADGGIPYHGYAEFEAAVDLLLDNPDLRTQLGSSGRRYVETTYAWPTVMERYEQLLHRAVAQAPQSRSVQARRA